MFWGPYGASIQELGVLFTDQRTLFTDQIGLQVTGAFHGLALQRTTYNEQLVGWARGLRGGQAAGWYGVVGKRLREIEGLGVEMLAGGGRRD